MSPNKLALITLAVAAGLTSGLPSSADYLSVPDNEFVEASTADVMMKDPLLVATPFLMTHDSGTGTHIGRHHIISTQAVDFQGQLACGARAFDIRLASAPVSGGRKVMLHHMNNEGWPALESEMVIWKGNWDQDLDVFTDFAGKNPNELVLLFISHCGYKRDSTTAEDVAGVLAPPVAIASQLAGARWSKRSCADPEFTNILKKHKIPVLNEEKDCLKGECLANLTYNEAKNKAKNLKGRGILAVITGAPGQDENFLYDNWDGSISRGKWAELDKYVKGRMTPFPNPGDPHKFWQIQTHWQGAPDYDDYGVNAWVAGSITGRPICTKKDGDGTDRAMWISKEAEAPQRCSNFRSKYHANSADLKKMLEDGKLNLLSINWICRHGSKIAEAMGTKVDKAMCERKCFGDGSQGVRGSRSVENGENCHQSDDCEGNFCGRYGKDGNKVCCPGSTFMPKDFGHGDYCGHLPAGQECRYDRQCGDSTGACEDKRCK